MYDEIFELIQNGELNKAQEQLENTPENDPKRYNISGLIYYQKKEFDKAKEEFEKGLKINPVDSDLLFNYGYLLKKHKSRERSMEILNENPQQRLGNIRSLRRHRIQKQK
jgi:Tfp pilus assembly protein PilF